MPAGWSNPLFGWRLDLDWQAPLDVLKDNVAADGYSIAAALAIPKLFPGVHPLWGFIPIFIISLGASILGSLLSAPEPDDLLVRFYKQVRPWGFWGPVLAKVRAADPSFAEKTWYEKLEQ